MKCDEKERLQPFLYCRKNLYPIKQRILCGLCRVVEGDPMFCHDVGGVKDWENVIYKDLGSVRAAVQERETDQIF